MADVTAAYEELTGQELSAGLDGKSFAFSARKRDEHWAAGLTLKGGGIPI